MLIPRRTFRAFLRGRRSRSLYGMPFEQVLSRSVAAARAEMGVVDDAPATAKDVALYVVTAIAGYVLGSILFWTMLPLVPVGLFMNLLRARQQRATS